MLLTGDPAGGRSGRNDRWSLVHDRWPLRSLLFPQIEYKILLYNGQIVTVGLAA